MIVALASRKASPGVTTLTGLLARSWEEEGTTRFVLEADPSGGTLAARWSEAHGVTWNPGLVDLALLRGSLEVPALIGASQPLGPGLQLFAAPPGPGQVANALATLGDGGAAGLAGADGARCFVDCGRLDGRSAALSLANRAVVTLLVLRPALEEINSAFAGVVELAASGCKVGLVVVGKGPWPADEIAAAAGVEVFGELPDDPRAARAFRTRGLHAGRALERSQLSRAVAELASNLRLLSASVRVPTVPSGDGPANGPVPAPSTEPIPPPPPRLAAPPPVHPGAPEQEPALAPEPSSAGTNGAEA